MMDGPRGRLWVLLTDGHRARIVVPDEAEGQFRTMLALGVSEDPFCPPSLRGEAAPPHPGHLATDVAQRLNEAAAEDAFAELLLVAPAGIGLEISRRLEPNATARTIGRLDRDYWALDDATLSRRLVRWWERSAAAAGEAPGGDAPGANASTVCDAP